MPHFNHKPDPSLIIFEDVSMLGDVDVHEKVYRSGTRNYNFRVRSQDRDFNCTKKQDDFFWKLDDTDDLPSEVAGSYTSIRELAQALNTWSRLRAK